MTLIEIYKLTDKSNCGECGLASCMAFAQAVATGAKDAHGCTRLRPQDADMITGQTAGAQAGQGFAASIEALRDKVRRTDLRAAAPGLGAVYKEGTGLSVNILCKEFVVDDNGAVTSELHVNNWIQWLMLTYASTPDPKKPEGRWVPFEELAGGRTTAGYFRKRFEEPLRVIADEHTDVLFELLGLFGGRHVDGYDADYAVELRPLPNVPMLVLYWRAEEDFPSKLTVMFDPAAASYLGPELITGMGRGLVEMLQKIIPRHEQGVLKIQYL
ncbi:MAG: DUF3786 domain-containing protein [Nitrospirae bacterium]|nr:DUF3786 domain-containing protein [Nitrospirota bacterium]